MPLTLYLSLKPLLAFRDFTHMWMFKSIILLLFGKLLWMTLLLVHLELLGIYAAPPNAFPVANVTLDTPLPSVCTTHMNFNKTFSTCPCASIPIAFSVIFQVNVFNMPLSDPSFSETFVADVA